MPIVVAFFHLALLATLAYWVWRQESSSLKIYYWPALIVKVLAGITLGLLYTYYYSVGDTFQYFYDGTRLATLAQDDVRTYFTFLWSGDESFGVWTSLELTVPRALFLVKIVSVLCFITLNNYWIISLYFSLASFYGAWLLVRQIVALSPSSKQAAVVAFLFFPSVVFWSSGLIKESLAMASLFFICSLFINAWQKKNLKLIEWTFMLVSFWILWNLKYYYLAVFLPTAMTGLVLHFFVFPFLKTKKIIVRLMVWSIVFTMLLIVVSFIHPNFYPRQFLEVIVSNNQTFVQQSDPHDVIQYYNLQPTALSILINSPWALFSGLFRPFVWEAKTIFQFLVAAENAIVFLLTISALLRWKEWLQSPLRLLVFSIVVYATILCVFLALSTPNFGTLVRFKVGFLPFLLLVILIDNPIAFRVFSFYERSISNLVR